MPQSSRIEQVAGRAIPVRGNDIDTDRIIPARYLKSVSFEGLEQHVFEDDRAALRARGDRHAFDTPAFAGATILLANGNFGCGLSREHAPQAIRRWGIRAVVAESFAEIFFGNSLAIGLPCLTASPDDMARVMAAVDAHPETVFTVDIRNGQLRAEAVTAPVEAPASARDALLSGDWDATGLLLADYALVERTAARLPYIAGF